MSPTYKIVREVLIATMVVALIETNRWCFMAKYVPAKIGLTLSNLVTPSVHEVLIPTWILFIFLAGKHSHRFWCQVIQRVDTKIGHGHTLNLKKIK